MRRPPIQMRVAWAPWNWRIWYWPGGTACLEPDEWTAQFLAILVQARWES